MRKLYSLFLAVALVASGALLTVAQADETTTTTSDTTTTTKTKHHHHGHGKKGSKKAADGTTGEKPVEPAK